MKPAPTIGKKMFAFVVVAFMIMASLCVVLAAETPAETNKIEDKGIYIDGTQTGKIHEGVTVDKTGEKITVTLDNLNFTTIDKGDKGRRVAFDIDPNGNEAELILKGKNTIKLDSTAASAYMMIGLNCTGPLTISGDEGSSLTVDTKDAKGNINSGISMGQQAGAKYTLTISAKVDVIAGVESESIDSHSFYGIDVYPSDSIGTLVIENGEVNVTMYSAHSEVSNGGDYNCLRLHPEGASVIKDSKVSLKFASDDNNGFAVTYEGKSTSKPNPLQIDGSDVTFSSGTNISFTGIEYKVKNIKNASSVMAGESEEKAIEMIDQQEKDIGSSFYIAITADSPVPAPTVTVTSQKSGTVHNAEFKIEGTTTDAALVEITVGQTSQVVQPTNNKFSVTVTLSQGANTIKVVAVNSAQVESQPVEFNITYTPSEPDPTPSENGNTSIALLVVFIIAIVAVIYVGLISRYN